MLALCPTLELAQEEITASRVIIHDKFWLIKVLFSDELGDMVIHSEESATHPELDAKVVGHKSQFWQIIELRFNDCFLPEGTDGKVHADLVQHNHPLSHQGDKAINPGLHSAVHAEKLRSLWKEIQSAHDAAVTKFSQSRNQQSSFMKVAMKSLNNNNNNDELA
jgi:hypothetical protein